MTKETKAATQAVERMSNAFKDAMKGAIARGDITNDVAIQIWEDATEALEPYGVRSRAVHPQPSEIAG